MAKKKIKAVDMKYKPSAALADVIGSSAAKKRGQFVKLLWVYIKAEGLQDEDDGRVIHPDSTLGAVLGKKTLTMFEMMKKLNKHLTLVD